MALLTLLRSLFKLFAFLFLLNLEMLVLGIYRTFPFKREKRGMKSEELYEDAREQGSACQWE